jgi:flagellin-specific chaperone FliS
MNSAIDECIEHSQITLDEDEFNKIKGQLDDFKVAYSSLRVLLALERKTGLTEHLSSFYRYLFHVEGLNDSYYLALHQYLYESKIR